MAILFNHFDQILGAINAARAAASPPLGALSWSQALAEAGYPGEPAPQQYGPIKSRHVLALRNRMDNALQALGLATPAYTDDLSTPTRIKAVHITQLQGRPQ
ncbi:MAG: hypothetical protein AABO58_15530 [Acidobacteriota bacterium]